MRPLTYKKVVQAITLLVVVSLIAVGAVRLSKAYVEYQSYLAVVVQAMNGDARFMVGNEMFECKGGRLSF